MEILPYNRNLRTRSRELRKNMTKAEKILWNQIRRRQLDSTQWYQQKPIGNYIVDFYCRAKKIVIELDGSQHLKKDSLEYDTERDNYLKSLGLTVLRFKNSKVLNNLDMVLKCILEAIRRN